MKEYIVSCKQYDKSIGFAFGEISNLTVKAKSAAHARHKINKGKHRIVIGVVEPEES